MKCKQTKIPVILRSLRALLLLLSVALLLTGTVLPAFATAPAEEKYAVFHEDEKNGAVIADFPVNEELAAPTTKTYYPYAGYQWYRLITATMDKGVKYEHPMLLDGDVYELYSDRYAGEILVLERNESMYILFTEEGTRLAQELIEQPDYDSYKLLHTDPEMSNYGRPEFELGEQLRELPKEARVTMTIPFGELRYLDPMVLAGYTDEAGPWVGMRVGMIFRLDMTYYYLPYDSLPTTAFDKSTGELNFDLKTDVTLYQLNTDLEEDYTRMLQRQYYNTFGADLTDEDDLLPATLGELIAVLSVFCTLPALAPIIVGLCKFFGGRSKGKRRWLLLLGMGALWLLCSLFITVLLAISM